MIGLAFMIKTSVPLKTTKATFGPPLMQEWPVNLKRSGFQTHLSTYLVNSSWSISPRIGVLWVSVNPSKLCKLIINVFIIPNRAIGVFVCLKIRAYVFVLIWCWSYSTYGMPKKNFDRKFCNLFSYRDPGIYPDEPVEIAEEAIDHPENKIHPHSD